MNAAPLITDAQVLWTPPPNAIGRASVLVRYSLPASSVGVPWGPCTTFTSISPQAGNKWGGGEQFTL